MSGYKEMRSTEQAETNQLIIIFIFLLTTSTQSDSDIPQNCDFASSHTCIQN